MAAWKEHLNIARFHRHFEDGKISVAALGKAVATKIRSKCSYYKDNDPEILDVVMAFSELKDTAELKDYCAALDMLYDFGDVENRLLIETLQVIESNEVDDNDDKTPVSSNSSGVSHGYTPPPKIIQPSNSSSSSSSSSKTRGRNNGNWDADNNYTLTTYEFDQKIKKFGIERSAIKHDMYDYLRKTPTEYHDWIFEIWHDWKPVKVQKQIEAKNE